MLQVKLIFVSQFSLLGLADVQMLAAASVEPSDQARPFSVWCTNANSTLPVTALFGGIGGQRLHEPSRVVPVESSPVRWIAAAVAFQDRFSRLRRKGFV